MNLGHPLNSKFRFWVSVVVILFTSVGIGFVRQVWWDFAANLPGPIGPWGIPLLPLFCGLLIIFIPFILFVCIWLLLWTQSYWSVLILMAGIAIAFIFPLPSPRPTEEELYFLKYREDYEQVVNMVIQGNLNVECTNYPGYRLPEQFLYLSQAGCIRFRTEGRIEFNPPFQGAFWLLYIPIPLEYPCFGGSEKSRIDEYWVVCLEEWN